MYTWQAMTDVKFNSLGYLHLFWVVLALGGVVAYGFARKNRSLRRLAAPQLLGSLTGQVSRKRQWAKAGLVLAAMAALVPAISDPRWGVYYEDLPRRGIDILFVLDVSRSMLANDLPPSRLERAKQSIGDVLDAAVGDRVGLVTFAGTPVLKCPLTVNYGAFRMLLDEVGVRSSPRGGTLIGDAVRLAAKSFVDPMKKHKAIVVLTDGDDQESYPVKAAEEAYAESGIQVFTVGLGDEGEGARVPAQEVQAGVFMQYDGREVWSKMNPAVLREMAMKGGGAYIPAGTKSIDLGQVLYEERIAKAEQREFETSRIEQRKVQFQWFAGLALLLLLIETFMTDRRAVEADSVA